MDAEKAKGLVVDRMTSIDLWRRLQRELDTAITQGEMWNTRDAFYAAARARACADELFLRGQQISFELYSGSAVASPYAVSE